MKIRFYYKEPNPSYHKYQELLLKMKDISKDFKHKDVVFKKTYDYKLMKKYEKDKMNIIKEVFNIIISYFPILNKIPCAIYLNGSYARRNITAGSDMDLTFYFNKSDVSRFQPLVYLIRNAISVVFDVNVVHVHSFTKNFTTEYRKNNNLVVNDKELNTTITWMKSGKSFVIDYPYDQMIPERELCEISSIKNIEDLHDLFLNQLKKYYPKEWIYTQERIHISDDKFSVENLLKEMDKKYTKSNQEKALLNIKEGINNLIIEINNYYNDLENKDEFDLASFNMIGKRKLTLLVHSLATFLRWYYINNNLKDVPLTLNLDNLFGYSNNNIINQGLIDDINEAYCYFRYLISRVEIWAKKYKHHYEHRSKEIIKKELFNNEYNSLWHNNYLPIKEQAMVVYKIIELIKKIVK